MAVTVECTSWDDILGNSQVISSLTISTQAQSLEYKQHLIASEIGCFGEEIHSALYNAAKPDRRRKGKHFPEDDFPWCGGYKRHQDLRWKSLDQKGNGNAIWKYLIGFDFFFFFPEKSCYLRFITNIFFPPTFYGTCLSLHVSFWKSALSSQVHASQVLVLTHKALHIRPSVKTMHTVMLSKFVPVFLPQLLGPRNMLGFWSAAPPGMMGNGGPSFHHSIHSASICWVLCLALC